MCAVDSNGVGCSASDLDVGESLNAYLEFSPGCGLVNIDSCRLELTGSDREDVCENYTPYSFGDKALPNALCLYLRNRRLLQT